MNRDVFKYCERILRLFLTNNSWSQELIEQVHAWLIDGEHCLEKEVAARQIFYEMLEKDDGRERTTELPDKIKEIIWLCAKDEP